MSALTPTAGYLFDNAATYADGQYRRLGAVLDPITFARLAGTGVGPGWHCLDVGTGDAGVARWLARRVAPSGSVTATDLEPVAAADAVTDAGADIDDDAGDGRAVLRIARHDITRDPLADAAFDLIHSRMVLRHLPERDHVLRRLLGALRPGGWLQIDEFDLGYGPVLLAPDAHSEALYEAFLDAKAKVFADTGADGQWGRKAAGAMRAAGFTAIDPVPRVCAWGPDSPGTRLLLHTARVLRHRLIGAGMTPNQLDEVCELMQHPEFVACSCVVYSVQGRRPA